MESRKHSSTCSSSDGQRCPLCGGEVKAYSSVGRYGIQRCSRCRLEFLHPQPDDACLTAIYGANYFLAEPETEGEERMSAMKRATAALYLKALQGAIGHAGGLRLLEIGCGHGDVLVEAQRCGFEVAGVEFSADAAAIANRRLGAPAVSVGAIDTVDLPAAHFDAVLSADVIEHVREPGNFLRRVHDVLKPGGSVMLITPSLDSWSRRFLGKRWMEYKVEHLFYFSERSMRRLLRDSAFGGIEVTANRKVLTSDYIARHFQRYPVPVLSQVVGSLRRAMPDLWAHRPIRIPASGMRVIARKELPSD